MYSLYDFNICRIGDITIITWRKKKYLGSNRKLTGPRNSWDGGTNLHTTLTYSTTVLQVHDRVQFGFRGRAENVTHPKVGGSRQEVRDRKTQFYEIKETRRQRQFSGLR